MWRSAEECGGVRRGLLHGLRVHACPRRRHLVRQVQATQRLTAEFQHAQSLLQEQLSSRNGELKELQLRFDSRDPRPEDLAMIEQLTRQVRPLHCGARHQFTRTARRTALPNCLAPPPASPSP